MARVQAFLGERLNLAVSAEKSGVSAASRGLRFLGFHVCAFTLRSPGVMARREGPNGRSWRVRQRPTEGNIKLWVPRERVYAFCRRKRYGNLDTRQPMGSGSHGLCDFRQVQAHGLRIASGQHQGRALTLLRADRPEDVD